MVDYNIGIPQQQYFQAPDLMQNAMRMQQMQTQNAQVDSTNRLRAMQMQGLAQDQQLNALKMQAANQAMRDAAAARAQGVSDRNALTNAIKSSVVGNAGPQMPDLRTAANLLASEGKFGPAATALGAVETFTKADKANADLSKINIENLDKELATFRTFAPTVRTPEDAGLFAASMFDHPRVGKLISQMGLDRDQAIAKAQQDFATDPQQWVASRVGLTAQQAVDVLKQKQTTTERAGSTVQQREDYFGRPMGAPEVIETAEQAEARRLAGVKGTKRAEAEVKVEEAAQANLPQIEATAEEAINQIDALIGGGKVDAKGRLIYDKNAKPAHPGFDSAVGLSLSKVASGPIPGSDRSDFEARFEQLKGGAFLEAFSMLRGGGAIDRKEGEKATAARTRMSLAQSEAEFVSAAREYTDIIKKGVARARARAQGGNAEALPQAQTDRAVKRSGMLNGRRVVEYNDGKVEYAD